MHRVVYPAGVTLLIALLIHTTGGTAHAQDFTLQVGSPVAVVPQPGVVLEKKVSKDTVFVVRPLGCPDPASVRMAVTAEGVLDGRRESVRLPLASLQATGVHAISKTWPDGGVWVLSVTGTCAGRTAGAIVTLGPRDVYRRDGVELVAHHPTSEEIEHALRRSARVGATAAPSR